MGAFTFQKAFSWRNKPSHQPLRALAENLAQTLGGGLTLAKVAVPLFLLGWTVVSGVGAFATSVVVMPLTVAPELTKQGITSNIIVERILDRMEDIRRQATLLAPKDTGAWDNVTGIRSANDFDRQIPELGSSANLVADALELFGMGKPVIKGEVLCAIDDAACSLDKAVFHLRVVDKVHRFPVSPTMEKDTETSIDGRLSAVARGLLERLNPMLFAADVYGKPVISDYDRSHVREAVVAMIAKRPDDAAMLRRQLAALMLPKHPLEAIAQFSLAVDIDKSDAKALAGLGQAFASAGQYQTAVEKYSLAIDAASKDRKQNSLLPTLHLNRGVSYYMWQESAKALPDFELAAATGDADATIDVAYTHLDLNDLDNALVAFKKASPLAKDNERTRFAIEFGQALTLFEAGKFKEAIRAFNAASLRDSTYLYVTLWQAVATMRQKNGTPIDEFLPSTVTTWPAPIVRYIRGQLTEPELRALAAKAEPNNSPETKLCEIEFYMGQQALAHNRTDEAAKHFDAAQKAIHTEINSEQTIIAQFSAAENNIMGATAVEYRAAKRELRRLAAKGVTPD